MRDRIEPMPRVPRGAYERTNVVGIDDPLVQCWCRKGFVRLTWAHVKAGVTAACDDPYCKRIHEEETNR